MTFGIDRGMGEEAQVAETLIDRHNDHGPLLHQGFGVPLRRREWVLAPSARRSLQLGNSPARDLVGTNSERDSPETPASGGDRGPDH